VTMSEQTLVSNDCRDPRTGGEGYPLRARWSFGIGLVWCSALMGLIGLIGGSPTRAQPTQRAAVEITFHDTKGSLELRGSLYRPEGPGPFPAVVALHGCSGIRPLIHHWASTLRQWGYAALLVDSFTPRGQTNICNQGFTVDPQYARMPDAYAAQAYLAQQPFVDSQRIGLMGWSHGGWTTLYAVDSIYLTGLHVTPFQAAIAFYPWCLPQLRHLNAPLLILIGDADDWTPASRCQAMLRQSETLGGKMVDRITLQVYPGAHHAFDGFTPPRPYYGHTVGRHPEAAVQAEAEVKRFLAQHLAMKP
jgi:dienelactone hydrolase